ncbi:MAG TPA: hypothetical protein VMY42_25910 [Thermoguttaceae bacterium]|nr:hypothetical protein [Thermoguttaceae bacterium]
MNREEIDFGGEDLQGIEDLIRDLPLRRPSSELDDRLASVWPARAVVRRRWKIGAAVAAAAALAAGLVVMLLRNPEGDLAREPIAPRGGPAVAEAVPQPEEPEDLPSVKEPQDRPSQPICIEQLWSVPASGQQEVVLRDEAPPMRRVSHQVVRHVRWIDEPNNVHIEWNIPSRQEVLVPLQYN